MKSRKINLLMIIPTFAVALFDMAITITHQPNQYWEGNLLATREGNPVAVAFMNEHVLGFFVLSAIWLSIIFLLGYFLPRKVSHFFLFVVFVLHCSAASTWVLSLGGFWLFVVFTIVACSVWWFFNRLTNNLSNKQH